MTLDEYTDFVTGIVGIGDGQNVSGRKLAYVALGLAGEAGEVADAVKKIFRDGHDDFEPAAEELGDVIYYWACLCAISGRRPSDVLRQSADKVQRKLGGLGLDRL
jgi:NTP pyrophosphatase (non-canonical NTP hydrolase)